MADMPPDRIKMHVKDDNSENMEESPWVVCLGSKIEMGSSSSDDALRLHDTLYIDNFREWDRFLDESPTLEDEHWGYTGASFMLVGGADGEWETDERKFSVRGLLRALALQSHHKVDTGTLSVYGLTCVDQHKDSRASGDDAIHRSLLKTVSLRVGPAAIFREVDAHLAFLSGLSSLPLAGDGDSSFEEVCPSELVVPSACGLRLRTTLSRLVAHVHPQGLLGATRPSCAALAMAFASSAKGVELFARNCGVLRVLVVECEQMCTSASVVQVECTPSLQGNLSGGERVVVRELSSVGSMLYGLRDADWQLVQDWFEQQVQGRGEEGASVGAGAEDGDHWLDVNDTDKARAADEVQGLREGAGLKRWNGDGRGLGADLDLALRQLLRPAARTAGGGKAGESRSDGTQMDVDGGMRTRYSEGGGSGTGRSGSDTDIMGMSDDFIGNNFARCRRTWSSSSPDVNRGREGLGDVIMACITEACRRCEEVEGPPAFAMDETRSRAINGAALDAVTLFIAGVGDDAEDDLESNVFVRCLQGLVEESLEVYSVRRAQDYEQASRKIFEDESSDKPGNTEGRAIGATALVRAGTVDPIAQDEDGLVSSVPVTAIERVLLPARLLFSGARAVSGTNVHFLDMSLQFQELGIALVGAPADIDERAVQSWLRLLEQEEAAGRDGGTAGSGGAASLRSILWLPSRLPGRAEGPHGHEEDDIGPDDGPGGARGVVLQALHSCSVVEARRCGKPIGRCAVSMLGDAGPWNSPTPPTSRRGSSVRKLFRSPKAMTRRLETSSQRSGVTSGAPGDVAHRLWLVLVQRRHDRLHSGSVLGMPEVDAVCMLKTLWVHGPSSVAMREANEPPRHVLHLTQRHGHFLARLNRLPNARAARGEEQKYNRGSGTSASILPFFSDVGAAVVGLATSPFQKRKGEMQEAKRPSQLTRSHIQEGVQTHDRAEPGWKVRLAALCMALCLSAGAVLALRSVRHTMIYPQGPQWLDIDVGVQWNSILGLGRRMDIASDATPERRSLLQRPLNAIKRTTGSRGGGGKGP